jgi:hypothetical protein
MDLNRKTGSTGARTSGARLEPERSAEQPAIQRAVQVDVLSANELRLFSTFVSRHLDERTEGRSEPPHRGNTLRVGAQPSTLPASVVAGSA